MRFRVLVRLKSTAQPLVEQIFECGPGQGVSFGRNLSKNDLVVPDPLRNVSGCHGIFECRDDGLLYVVDKGSRNGTYYEGQLITESGVLLGDEAKLEVGGCALEIERLPDLDPVPDEDYGTDSQPPTGMEQAALASMRSLARVFLPEGRLETPEDIRCFTSLLEQFADCSLVWMTRALQGRAAFEQEFGAEVTLVLQRGDNPLKHLNAQDIGKYVLDWAHENDEATRRAYVESVFRDLAEHQLGLLAGVREAISAVVERVAPSTVMALSKSGGGRLGSKAARAWNTYEKLFEELMTERGKLFLDVISPALQHGYLSHHDDADNSGEIAK